MELPQALPDFLPLTLKLAFKPSRRDFTQPFSEKKINLKFKSEENQLSILTLCFSHITSGEVG